MELTCWITNSYQQSLVQAGREKWWAAFPKADACLVSASPPGLYLPDTVYNCLV
jgi:hypothetical protein